MQFSVFQDSLIGGRRSNQDRMGYRFTQDCVLLVLADGMGGHMRGEEAATIAVQTLAKAFDAFYRHDRDGGGEGMGIGLSIVRRLGERFGWPVELESAPGEGTIAIIRFRR